MTGTRNRLSPQGRERCAESGRRNAAEWNNRRAAVRQEMAALAQERRDGLLRDLGGTASAAQLILVDAMTAGSLGIRALSARFQQGQATSEQLAQLTTLTATLLRAARALRLIERDDGAEGGAGPSLAAYLKQREATANDHH